MSAVIRHMGAQGNTVARHGLNAPSTTATTGDEADEPQRLTPLRQAGTARHAAQRRTIALPVIGSTRAVRADPKATNTSGGDEMGH